MNATQPKEYFFGWICIREVDTWVEPTNFWGLLAPMATSVAAATAAYWASNALLAATRHQIRPYQLVLPPPASDLSFFLSLSACLFYSFLCSYSLACWAAADYRRQFRCAGGGAGQESRTKGYRTKCHQTGFSLCWSTRKSPNYWI